MDKPLRVLILEDNLADAELIQMEMGTAGMVITARVVAEEASFIRELGEFKPDIILSDYDLPTYTGAQALAEAQRRCPDIPFILVTGAVTEDRAIEILTSGAKDFVMKDRLNKLVTAVRRAIAEAEEHRARRKAEEEAHEASHYARSLIEASLDPLVTIGPGGKITDVNIATEEVTGVRRDQIIGTDFSDYFTDPGKARAGYEKVFSEGSVKDYPLAIRHTSGRITEVLYNASVYRDENGEVQGVFAAARDVTELKKAEEELRKAVYGHLEDTVRKRTFELEAEIAERKKAEMEAVAGRARLSMALEAADTVLWEWDISTRSFLYSDNIRAIVRGDQIAPYCSLDEVMELVHTEDRARLAEALDRASSEGIPFECEYRVRMLDGVYRWILGKGKRIVMERGKPVRVLGLSTDITDRKLTETALQEIDDRFRYALETSHTGAWSLRLNDHTASRSLEHDHIFGYHELLPQWTYEMFLDHVLPEDRAIVDARFRQAVQTQGEWDFDCRIRRSDGEVRWIWAAGSYRTEAGGEPYIAGIVQDITERKKTEEALREKEERHRLLWETMLQGVVHQDADGKIISMNPAAERILGKGPEEFVGETSTSVEHHTLREDGTPFPGLEHPSMVALRTGQQVSGVVMGVFNPRESAYRWVSIDAVPLFRPSEDSPFQVYTVFEDISAKKQAEEELVRRAQDLEAINKELESFSYTVSHDLRAPLRAIDGYSRMILRQKADTFDEETKRLFAQVGKGVQTMGQLIEDLLALSRLTRQDLNVRMLDMRELFEKTWQEVRREHADRNIILKVNPLPLAAGDAGLVRQVVVNILSNAVKFTQNRDLAVIEVEGHEDAQRHETVYSVADNGVGFDMQYRDKLFGVFKRLHGHEYEGTGIGLSLVERIIHRHGGRVWAEARVNEGATFYFTLPATG